MPQYYTQSDFFLNVCVLLYGKLYVDIISYHLLDGLDKVDLNGPVNPLQAQAVGLLQAVAYLKGM